MTVSVCIPWPVVDRSIAIHAPELTGVRVGISASVCEEGIMLTFHKPAHTLTPNDPRGVDPYPELKP